MQTTLPRDLGSRFIPFPMIPGSPALMPEPGIEAVKVSGVALLPLSQDDLIASCASGEATGVKKYAGRSFYLFTEKAVKKLLHRRKRTPAIPARETKLPAAICERTLNFYSRSHIATRIATRAAAG